MSTAWYRIVSPRAEVSEGRSFHPDEFAIALEQVVAGSAPADYREPGQFFARTSFTRALTENVGLIMRRLLGETANTAPVLTLLTQFGGGKTHTLTALYHLASNGDTARSFPGVEHLMANAFLPAIPKAKVSVFVGNAWDPQPGKETPWIDLARRLAGDAGVELLGTDALTTPPGTETLQRIFYAAGEPVLLLFDEVLNFINRHRRFAEPFYAYLQNLTVAMTGTTNAALVVSLPRSQVEMTDWDIQWQDRITKVVRRVASNLVTNDEGEIADVVCRRLFEDRGSAQVRRNVARLYADWCFDNRAQLPPEWTAVETARNDSEARDFLRTRFEAAYPFHPATLSVFQRKWSSVSQFQATRGTLAMLAQWVSLAYRDGYTYRRDEPLITLGSAPLHSPEFRGVVLGQLGETRLMGALDTDIAGDQAHARALDVDTRDALKDIHRRVGAAIFFESSGGQVNRIGHLPELRFAIGAPSVDTTSVHTAAIGLEGRSFYIRRIGSDGFQISYRPTLKKVVSERRASLDYRTEVLPKMRRLVQDTFDRGRTLSLVTFPADESAVDDTPRLTLVVMDPEVEWNAESRARLVAWTRQRGQNPRLYPGALVWCIKQPGSKLRQEVQDWLGWQRVLGEIESGTLGGDLTPAEIRDVRDAVRDEGKEAQDEVWASYRYLVLFDPTEADGLRVIDLGVGHASSGETLSGRVIAALKANSLLNEGIGAGYLDRNWPPALLQSGAWPLTSLRQSFLNGALTRLLDPDNVLRARLMEFISRGDFGLASGPRPDGTYERVWYNEMVLADEIAFEPGVFLIKKEKAQALKAPVVTPPPTPGPEPQPNPNPGPLPPAGGDPPAPPTSGNNRPVPPAETITQTVRLTGSIPADSWNRVGTRLIPKLRSGGQVQIEVEISVDVESSQAQNLIGELNQILEDLGLAGQVGVKTS
jgi:hypothetical protein